MSKRAKYFLLVMAAQTTCLSVGLWMHHHFAVASAYRELRVEMWSGLENSAQAVQPVLEGVRLGSIEPASPEFSQLVRILGTIHPRVDRAMLVDPTWRAVVSGAAYSPLVGKSPVAPPAPGSRIDWKPLADLPQNDHRRLRGTFSLPDGEYFGAAYPLGEGQGYLVVCHSVAGLQARCSAVALPLFSISIMTLLWTCAVLGIGVYLIMARFHENIDIQRERTSSGILQRTQTLVRTRDAVIFGLAKLADSRDPETGDHLERITEYSTTLAKALHGHPKFGGQITRSFVRLIGISSALHDIGKVGIEDRILLKPGPLTEEERKDMQEHSPIGGECLLRIEQRLGSSNFLQMAREITFAHHERWDGTGYPNGLAGEEIPLSARVVAIADVYDALSSKRVYKEAIPHQRCVEIIRSEAGKQFDADMIEAWLTVTDKFRQIARQYGKDEWTDTMHDPDEPSSQPEPELPHESTVLAVETSV